ncbi:MAG: hypothetical protein M1294_16385 [Firmicutes bacterium]|jgi:hypothetical protein|uniref:Uncharacterized protein n=1 Tax=Sulfobacillus benefaciens TaxID=453960 RepID=A0A2T2WNM7_9FIRM|nr:hypothetical protein [Bacillota bacterium]MCL5014491.1 hypothetical protein [Bacillota bacterium]PSR23855.1 MAG: hypothetical protein C7B43_19830 [Sulfobacillus benefaciens]
MYSKKECYDGNAKFPASHSGGFLDAAAFTRTSSCRARIGSPVPESREAPAGYNGFPIQSVELAKLRLILSDHRILLGFVNAAVNLNLFLENKFATAIRKDYSVGEDDKDDGEDDEK